MFLEFGPFAINFQSPEERRKQLEDDLAFRDRWYKFFNSRTNPTENDLLNAETAQICLELTATRPLIGLRFNRHHNGNRENWLRIKNFPIGFDLEPSPEPIVLKQSFVKSYQPLRMDLVRSV